MNRWVTTIIESNAADSVKKAKADVCDIAKGWIISLYIFIVISMRMKMITHLPRGLMALQLVLPIKIWWSTNIQAIMVPISIGCFTKNEAKRIYTILFIHDAEMLRGKVDFDEAALFNEATLLIVHSQAMQTALVERGVIRKWSKTVFDYRHKEVSVSHERPENELSLQEFSKTLFTAMAQSH